MGVLAEFRLRLETEVLFFALLPGAYEFNVGGRFQADRDENTRAVIGHSQLVQLSS
jgi:hypothetical protein